MVVLSANLAKDSHDHPFFDSAIQEVRPINL